MRSATIVFVLTSVLGAVMAVPPAVAGDGAVILAQTSSGGHSYRRPDPDAGQCNPALAVEKARYMGVDDARVYNVTPNVVRVRGKRKGSVVTLVFANQRHCPLLG